MYGGPGCWTAVRPPNERHGLATAVTPVVIGPNRRLYVLLSIVLLPEAKKDVRTGSTGDVLFLRHT